MSFKTSGPMPDWRLRELGEKIIMPFVDGQINRVGPFRDVWAESDDNLISWGLSSYGYDVRVKDEYSIYHNLFHTYIDPKAFDRRAFTQVAGDGYAFIPPNSFALTETIEYVRVPRNCIVLVCAKSTYARCGLVVNATVLEPEWEGTVTLELSNTTPLPIKVYSEEGVVQLMFFESSEECEVSYKDRKGKYMNQMGITLPKV